MSRDDRTDGFTWLHLSDLHAGMAGQWLWPGVKDAFFEDLRRVLAANGPVHAVIFSGDLTQCGTRAEFDQVTCILEELWQELKGLGCTPLLFAVPGNHDLVRPSPRDPVSKLLGQWWSDQDVQEETWSDPTCGYRMAIDAAFSNFTDWWAGLSKAGFPIVRGTTGIMPGDIAGKIDAPGGAVGLIGLNSAWLQLGDGDYEKRLSVDSRQLLAVTGDDPGGWVRGIGKSLLVTHHPASWLNQRAKDGWDSDVFPTSRFSAHLYGHMHDPDATQIAHGGSASRTALQAASLFGLEKIDRLNVRRIHGYSVGRLEAAGGIRIWPRRHTLMKSRDWKLLPDQEFDLDKSESFKLGGPPAPISLTTELPAYSDSEAITSLGLTARAPEIREKLSYFVAPSPASLRVRRVEQKLCIDGLSELNASWVIAEWGSGSDGFLRAVQDQIGLLPDLTFRLDCTDFTTEASFPDLVKSKLGYSLPEVLDALAEISPVLLILDDVPTSRGPPPPGKPPVETAVEAVVSLLATYCPGMRIILRSRLSPQSTSYTVCELRPLDEADLRLYVADHERGGPEFLSPEAVSAIFRHTDGVPARIDAILRELELVTVGQLALTNRDLVHAGAHSDDVPKALSDAVSDLARSKEPDRQRSYELLKALSAFPNGEPVERLKRFNGSRPIFPIHARELLSTSLITTVAAPTGPISTDHAPKLLVVPRPVRDYVRSCTTPDELSDITKKAATLYFGDNWKRGEIKKSLTERYKNPIASGAEIGNATSIVLRLMRDGLDRSDRRLTNNAVELARAYITLLQRGDHFRAVAILAIDIIAMLEEDESESAAFFQVEVAKATRMLGDNKLSLDLYSGINTEHMPVSRRQSILVNVALAHQRLGEDVEALVAAKECVRLDRQSAQTMQAQAIIAECSGQADTLSADLRRLEAKARKRNAHVLANNLTIARVDADDVGSDERSEALSLVINTARDAGDFYNLTRAILGKVKDILSERNQISDRDKSMLIDAYHFLLSERLPVLFDRCHSLLWQVFELSDDTVNLFRLFRHSSLIWRLRSDEAKEERYLRKLAAHYNNVLQRELGRLERELVYFSVRKLALPTVGEAYD